MGIDHLFFGESMFTRKTDGSKVALATLVQSAPLLGINLIDCQMTTQHLLRFGARELSRDAFQEQLEANIEECRPQKKWRLLPGKEGNLEQTPIRTDKHCSCR